MSLAIASFLVKKSGQVKNQDRCWLGTWEERKIIRCTWSGKAQGIELFLFGVSVISKLGGLRRIEDLELFTIILLRPVLFSPFLHLGTATL